MQQNCIGVRVDDLGIDVKSGIRHAATMGFGGLEVGAVAGEMSPEQLSSSGRRHLRRFVNGLGLRLDALAADFPGQGIGDGSAVDQIVSRSCRVIDLAADLNVPVVTGILGDATEAFGDQLNSSVVEAMRQIGDFADLRGITYAVRPTCNDGSTVADLLDTLDCDSLRVGMDPAELVMHGIDPMSSIDRLATRVAHVHARDATPGGRDRIGHETVLGEGSVDLVGLLSWLAAAEYNGCYVVRRSSSANPAVDVEQGKSVLIKAMP